MTGPIERLPRANGTPTGKPDRVDGPTRRALSAGPTERASRETAGRVGSHAPATPGKTGIDANLPSLDAHNKAVKIAAEVPPAAQMPATEVTQSSSPEAISREKITDFQGSFTEATPKIRELLGVEPDAPDTHFVGLFGSCAKGTANEGSDIDGSLFFKRSPTTSSPVLASELAETFDIPLPDYPEGTEDIVARDITTLPQTVAYNSSLTEGDLRDIALIFSPVTVGDEALITNTRNAITDSMSERTGQLFDPDEPSMTFHDSVRYGDFETHRGDGQLTWGLVQEKYRTFFGQELPPLPEQAP